MHQGFVLIGRGFTWGRLWKSIFSYKDFFRRALGVKPYRFLKDLEK